MILLRPRATFRGAQRKRWPVAKITRAERAANKKARDDLAAGMEPVFVEVFDTFRLDADDSFRRQLTTGGAIGEPQEAMVSLEANLSAAVAGEFDQGIASGQQIGVRFAGAEGVDLDPDLVTMRADAWINSEGAKRIDDINRRETRAIRTSVQRALRDEISPEQAARRISREAGLSAADARALEAFRVERARKLIRTPEADTQFARETIEDDVERYRTTLLRRRGRLIAENEGQVAIQEGERQFYDEAISQGQIDGDLLIKRWFTVQDERVCPICAPLHGVILPFKESFASLGFVGLSPPAHPRCRCFLEYGPDNTFDDADRNRRQREQEQQRLPATSAGGPLRFAPMAGQLAFVVGAAAGLGFFGTGVQRIAERGFPRRHIRIPIPQRLAPVIPLVRPARRALGPLIRPFLPIAARRLSKQRPRMGADGSRRSHRGRRFGIY